MSTRLPPTGAPPAPAAAAPPLDESRAVSATETSTERKLLSDMEELYAIMQTTEHLENAYIRDLIPADEYKSQCSKLLRSYDLQLQKLRSMGAFADVKAWMMEYCVNVPQAYLRLEIVRLPATDTHYTDDSRPNALVVSETTSAIITAMDALNMGRVEVDQVAPYLSAALESLNKHAWLGPEFEPKAKLQDWKRTVGALRASDSLSAEQARQLLFDLEQAYTQFLGVLGGLAGSK